MGLASGTTVASREASSAQPRDGVDVSPGSHGDVNAGVRVAREEWRQGEGHLGRALGPRRTSRELKTPPGSGKESWDGRPLFPAWRCRWFICETGVTPGVQQKVDWMVPGEGGRDDDPLMRFTN